MMNKNRMIIFFLLIFSLFSFSCDILRYNRFEVMSWSPGEGYFNELENINISLNFSIEANRASVEKNFSLTGNGNRIKGNFIWEGKKKMVYVPLSPLELNIDYVINLSSEAYCTNGLNLDENFIGNFTTRFSFERPVLLSYYPELYEIIDDPGIEVRLCFSMPVSLNSLYESVSFSPSMTGIWRLEKYNENTIAIFTPFEPWKQRTKYEIRYSTSLTGINGMNIGNEFLSVFTVGSDIESPTLILAERITKDGENIDLFRYKNDLNLENENWEKDDKLKLIFSEPVDINSVKNNLSCDDGPSFILDTSPLETENGFINEISFKFDKIPAYNSRFVIRLKPGVKDKFGNESTEEYVYKVVANGEFSKPPVFIGFRIPMAPVGTEEDENDFQLESFDINSDFKIISICDNYYPLSENIPTWIELYFDASADIDLFSVMELFRIETSNLVINFSPRSVKNKNFTVTDTVSNWENYKRIEINGILTNSINFGIIYFQIGAGLADSLGNKNENLQQIAVIK